MKKEVQIYILSILTSLNQILPGVNHNFALGADGRLWLWIGVQDKWQSIIFDENYEDIQPEKLIEEILKSLKESGYEIRNT